MNKDFNEAVFCRLDTLDYNVRMDGKKSNKNDFYTNPKKYKSTFMKYAKHTDIFIQVIFMIVMLLIYLQEMTLDLMILILL